jgi:hypothetical protein
MKLLCFVVVIKQTHGSIEDLETLRQQIAQLHAETSDGLKKNVYKHYHQFIETSKEISSMKMIIVVIILALRQVVD